MQETFVTENPFPSTPNKRTELVKNPKIFFLDNGFRNCVIDNFTNQRSDKGARYENFICTELIKHKQKIRSWRTKPKAEIDFVVEKEDSIYPIEIKSYLDKTKITKSFLSFIEQYTPKKGYILSENFFWEWVYTKTKIEYCPIFYLWCFGVLSFRKLFQKSF